MGGLAYILIYRYSFMYRLDRYVMCREREREREPVHSHKEMQQVLGIGDRQYPRPSLTILPSKQSKVGSKVLRDLASQEFLSEVCLERYSSFSACVSVFLEVPNTSKRYNGLVKASRSLVDLCLGCTAICSIRGIACFALSRLEMYHVAGVRHWPDCGQTSSRA